MAQPSDRGPTSQGTEEEPNKLTLVEVPEGDLTDEQIDALLLKALSSMTGRTVKLSETGMDSGGSS